MSLIIPIENAGEIALEQRRIIFPAFCSFRVIAADMPHAPALAALELTGETSAPSFCSFELFGEFVNTALARLGVGEGTHTASSTAFDTGRVDNAPALSTIDITGEVADGKALASLTVEAINSLTGSIIYSALASLILSSEAAAAAYAVLELAGEKTTEAFYAFGYRMEIDTQAELSLEVAASVKVPALASLNTGGEATENAAASFEVETGEGIDIMIEVIDDILSGAHGDC